MNIYFRQDGTDIVADVTFSEKIRETSYQQGWNDAKQKKAKEKYFKWSFGYIKKD